MAGTYAFKGSGARIKQLRQQMGLSQDEMARKIGVTLAGYYKNESGETFPGYATLARLEKEHDIAIDWLMFGKGPVHYRQERQRVEALEKRLAELEKERDQEREKMAAFEKEMAGKLIVDDKPGLKELFDYMDRVPLLYHEIMVYFQKFKTTTPETQASPPAETTDSP